MCLTFWYVTCVSSPVRDTWTELTSLNHHKQLEKWEPTLHLVFIQHLSVCCGVSVSSAWAHLVLFNEGWPGHLNHSSLYEEKSKNYHQLAGCHFHSWNKDVLLLFQGAGGRGNQASGLAFMAWTWLATWRWHANSRWVEQVRGWQTLPRGGYEETQEPGGIFQPLTLTLTRKNSLKIGRNLK